MRIQIYNDQPTEKDEVLCLKLDRRSDGSRVKVIAVNPETGAPLPCGNLLTFNNDGTIKLSSGVTAPGIKGQIKVVSTLR